MRTVNTVEKGKRLINKTPKHAKQPPTGGPIFIRYNKDIIATVFWTIKTDATGSKYIFLGSLPTNIADHNTAIIRFIRDKVIPTNAKSPYYYGIYVFVF